MANKKLDKIVEGWNNLGKPCLKYTAAQALQNGIVIACQNEGNIVSAGEDVAKNLPFFIGVNLVYAKVVDYSTRKWGRLGANAVSLLTTAGFYAYARLTNDNDPTIPSIIAGGVGLYLTNRQASHVLKEVKLMNYKEVKRI